MLHFLWPMRPRGTSYSYLICKTQELEENHIYGDIEEQIQIVNIYSDILEQREILRNQKKDEDSLNMRAQCTPLVI